MGFQKPMEPMLTEPLIVICIIIQKSVKIQIVITQLENHKKAGKNHDETIK